MEHLAKTTGTLAAIDRLAESAGWSVATLTPGRVAAPYFLWRLDHDAIDDDGIRAHTSVCVVLRYGTPTAAERAHRTGLHLITLPADLPILFGWLCCARRTPDVREARFTSDGPRRDCI
ncbi:hypothetical protein [Rhodococcus sp. NPDC049939]|uniref:hypothetical protein n=1 Tax=Rhodococcus sp. NPDC049939 TaxID=3155511 RepID=UPI0033DD742F